ncbi:MAG TPA: DUF1349 domain-containing protein [Pseudorhizobium sp.]|nr:DUF1349 domain-containing protein [Pseudorhizobium sp.]
MVRLDERRWVKTGIEFSDGYGLLGSVLTDEASDWATGRYHCNPSNFWIRVTVQSGVLRINHQTMDRHGHWSASVHSQRWSAI